ncbi:MAG: RNA ligase family protein [Planctomycetes bacterium]|nr:RNA ligase family protein [Planctomycetota bacterium]
MAKRREILASDAIVEEKLDGANVSLWLADGRVEAAGRAGVGAMDRGRQLGRLRAWAAGRDAALRKVLRPPVRAVYGEWLWRTHTVEYGALPDLLVVLDLWESPGRFALAARRDELCADAGLATPPVLFRGVPGSLKRLEALCGSSTFGAPLMEGVVVRVEGKAAPVARAKLLAPGFRRLDDAAWARRGVKLNGLAQ